MYYHNTVISVLALLSAHSDVVHSAPSNFQGHQARENLGGRAATGGYVEGSNDVAVKTSKDGVEARTATYVAPGALSARGPVADALEDPTAVVNFLSACGGLGLIAVTYAAVTGRITVHVAESGRMRTILNRCGIRTSTIDHAVERMENGIELVEQVAPGQAPAPGAGSSS